MVLLIGTPEPVELPARLSPWTSCIHRWTADGATWDLSSGESGVWLGPGLRGLNMPPVQHYRRKSASVPGSSWRGSVTEERSVFWPITIDSGDGSQAWIDHNRRFWETLHPNKTGVWSVTQPGDGNTVGETRYLRLRFDDDGDFEEDIASELVGWADYGIKLTAEQPYWAGETIPHRWVSEVPLNYYGGGPVNQPGFGPPFVTSSSVSMSSAAVENPGHVEALPVWTFFGPFTSAFAGIGQKLIDVPFALDEGEWLRVDTSRSDRRAMFGSGPVLPGTGVNRTRDLGRTTKFGEVPPGASVPLSIGMGGYGGSIEFELVPLYWTAR